MSDFAESRGCLGKVTYEDMQTAQRTASEMHLNPYKCPWCGKWHLASKSKHHKRGGGRPSNQARRSWRR